MAKEPGDKRSGKKPRFSRGVRWSIFLIIIALTFFNIYYNFRRAILVRALPYITAEIKKYVSEELGAEVTWDAAYVDYLSRIIFRDIVLRIEEDDQPVAGIALLVVKIDESRLFESARDPASLLRQLTISGLRLRISRDKEGVWNFSSMIKPSEKPFDPSKFPLRARVKLVDCEVEYFDPVLPFPPGEGLIVKNLRGGVDLTKLDDARLGLLLDISGYSSRPVSLRGRVNILESSFDLSLASEFDAAPVASLFKDETRGLEASGRIALGVTSTGTFANGVFSPEPKGVITLKDCGFSHPSIDEPLSDVNGAIQLDLSADFSNLAMKAYTDGLKFKYGGGAEGIIAMNAAWLGELGYNGRLDVTGLRLDSLKSLIPVDIWNTYEPGGSVDAGIMVFGVDKDISIDARIIPSPSIDAAGMSFNSGICHLAYSGGRLHLKNIALGTAGGAALEARGLLDFREKDEFLVECSVSDIPISKAGRFYPPAAEWELDGYVSGNISIRPSGNSRELTISLSSDFIHTAWFDIDSLDASFRVGPDGLTVYGLNASVLGGNLVARSTDDGTVSFWATGLQGSEVVRLYPSELDVNASEILGKGKIYFDNWAPRFEAEFAMTEPSWKEVTFKSLTGDASYDGRAVNLNNVMVVGQTGELVTIEGSIPLTGSGDISFDLGVSGLDIGAFIPGRNGQPLSRTDINVKLTGTSDDIQLNASLIEHSLNLLGNKVYTCESNPAGSGEPPDPSEIRLTGRIFSPPETEGSDTPVPLSDFRISDLVISGAIYTGPFPSGLPDPSEYRHSLYVNTSKRMRTANGAAFPIEGLIALDGRFDGSLSDLVGGVSLFSKELKLGLQKISNMRVALKAGGSESFAIDGEWRYPSGGTVAVEGPAGWDPEIRKGFVDLFLNIDDAPIKEILAFAGIDVSRYAEGLFDGEGRITGPLDELSLKGFQISASEGSRLFGLQLETGQVEFEFGNGFLDLSKFEIISRERVDGGRSSLEGSGRIYMEESGLLPQAQLTAKITDYRLESLQSLFDLNVPLGGRVDADINYTEQGNKWNLEYELQLGELVYRGKTLPAVNAAFSFDPLGGRISISRIAVQDGHGGFIQLDGSVTIGLLSALFDPNQRRDLRYQRLDLNLTGSDFDLDSFAAFLPKDLKAAGKIKSIDLSITGKPTQPKINGTLVPEIGPIAYAGFVIADSISTQSGQGLVWEDGLLKLAADLAIKRGESIALLDGDIDLRVLNPLTRYDPRYVPPATNQVALRMATPEPIRMAGEGFWFDIKPEDIVIGISGNGANNNGGGLDINGRLNVSSANLDALRLKIPQGSPGAGKAPVKFDITIALGPGCRLKAGKTLDATLQSGELNLSGTPLSPRLQGGVRIAQGRLNFLARTFNLLPGAEVVFNPLFGVNPFLKAEAEAVISQHPKAETGAEPLIITARIESFLSDIGKGMRFSSNYPYTSDELLAILGYQHIFLALEEEGLSSAFESGIYLYPSGLISRYVEELAGFHRFELTFDLQNNVVIDLEKELFNSFFLTYNQTFGEGTNYIWGSKYRFRPRSYVGLRYSNLDFQDKQDWFYFVEYLMPLK